MQTITLGCNNCGAQLEVLPSANYVTCNTCHAQLTIGRNESTTFTEKVVQLAEQTERLTSEVVRLQKQNDLAALDRRWASEREPLMIATKRGTREPDKTRAAVGGTIGIGFSIVWTMIAGATCPPMVLVGIVLLSIVVYSMLVEFSKADDLETARDRYNKQRRKLKSG